MVAVRYSTEPRPRMTRAERELRNAKWRRTLRRRARRAKRTASREVAA